MLLFTGNLRLHLADEAYQNELYKAFKNIEILNLNWWEHNQHMTIFANVSRRGCNILQSIYLERRLRYSQINPIILKNKKDNKILLETFSAYYIKGTNKLKTEEKIDPIEPKHINDYTKRLIKKIKIKQKEDRNI